MKTLIFGHRGASGYAPENTLEAFELAIKQGAEGVELDVHLTRDKEIIVAHDERIDRVSDGIGRINDLTLKDIKKQNFNATHPNWENAKAPTLREVFELFSDNDLIINIELKNSYIIYKDLEEKCLDLAAKMGMEDRIIYSSFNHYSMQKLKKLKSDAVCGLLYEGSLINPWDYAKSLNMDAIHPHFSELISAPDECEKAHRLGLKVNYWTVNDEKNMRLVINKGADCLITNYPDRGVMLRESLGV